MSHKVNIDFGSGATMNGQTWGSDGDAGDVTATGDDFIVNTAAATPGNTFDIWCDGYRWYVQGVVGDLTDAAFSTGADTIA